MKAKIAFIFLLAIFIPTSFLAYFGLLAVRSEKSIVERSIRQKYEAIADIVEGEIRSALNRAQKELLDNPKYVEYLVTEQASIFKDEVAILDKEGRQTGQKARGDKPMLIRELKDVPYAIAVYERYPLLLNKVEQKKQNLYLYMSIIWLSALSILAGSFFTLSALSRQWRMAQLKNEFVQHLSHELRRPLTSIRMFSEMLKTGRVPSEDKKQEYYGIVAAESERLTHLANNVLDFSRIETGRKSHSFKKEDLAKVVTDVVERFKNYIMEETHPVSLNIEEGLPPVNVDESAISQAIMNLLTNAEKYSPPGKKIRVNLLRKDKTAIVEVMDQGIGIPRSEQEKIFQKFYRVSHKDVVQAEGSGLGLTLVKYVAEAHGGGIKVESEEGKGSKFSLVLPI